LRGRRRKALRKNLRAAATAGIRCEVVADSRRAGDEVSLVLRRRYDDLTEAEVDACQKEFRELVARPEMTVIVARDQGGGVLAVLAAIVDDSVCAIDFAISTCHHARWALHDHLVRILVARRVRYLFSADEGLFGALGYSSNVQHYQHLLGYELRHLIPASARVWPGWPRRSARIIEAAVRRE
jgi:hypothetical protein